jgi:hypothetical protein
MPPTLVDLLDTRAEPPANDTMLLRTPSENPVPTLGDGDGKDSVAAPNIATSSTANEGPDHSNLILRYSDKTQWPAWLGSAVDYLNGVSDTPGWGCLVKNFIVLEGLQKFSTVANVSHQT